MSQGTDASRPVLRIASLPGTTSVLGVSLRRNPYIDLFANALASEGVQHVAAIQVSREWLDQEAGSIDALHVHWPEPIWRDYLPKPVRLLHRRVRGMGRVVRWLRKPLQRLGVWSWSRFLDDARRRGLRIIWTLHDLEHPIGMSSIDRSGRRVLASRADLVICHARFAEQELLRQYPTTARTVLMPLGNYENVYPNPRPRALVREELGLRSDLPAVACIGLLRDSKGLDEAIEAVQQLNGRVQLIIGGRPNAAYDLDQLRRTLDRLPGVALRPCWLSDQELADLHAASDAVLLPYQKITTSAALLTAVSLGCPVVATDLPFFREILENEPDAGVLVGVGDAAALAAGIEACLAVPAAVRSAAARRLAAQYAWPKVIKPVAEVFRGWGTRA